MLDYDFAKLNDKEFEAFCVDLLSEHFGSRFERFKPGKDSGVDGRYFNAAGKEIILQCKHWTVSGIDALIRQLRKVESAKLDRLRPARYVLATSIPLSRRNKSEIQGTLSPWIKSPSDILGQEDLNSILGNHRAVEERHYKLWFASVSILLRLQNASIKGRSEFTLEEARGFAPKYVVTKSHNEAIEKLERVGTVIITGEPGIGKSTLAEQIALQYALKGFELCSIADTVDEAEAIWDKNAPQLFYFDDFLGRNYLLALNRHEDSHIVGLIKRVREDSKKRFILTSRTTVLNQGKALTDLFRIENLDRNEYELTVDKLSLVDKARILYNHVWHSELDRDYIDEIYVDARYLTVSRHRNYNPRLIAFITDYQKVEGVTKKGYWNFVEDMLLNPKDVWAHVIENQLTASARILVRLAVFNGRDIDEEKLKLAFGRYASACGEPATSEAFDSAIRLTVGAVLNRTLRESDLASLSLFNPSLGDFTIRQYRKDSREVASCLAALQTEASLLNLRSLIRSKIIDDSLAQQIVSFLVLSLLGDPSIDLPYRMSLATLCLRTVKERPDVADVSNAFILSLLTISVTSDAGTQAELLEAGISSGVLAADAPLLIAKIAQLMENGLTDDDFQSISQLISNLQVDERQELEEAFISLYVEHRKEVIEQELYEYGTLDQFTMPNEVQDAKETLRSFIEEKVSELFLAVDELGVDEIFSIVDVEHIVFENHQRAMESHEFSPSTTSEAKIVDEIAAVHDLFEREKIDPRS